MNNELECKIKVWYEKEFITKKCPDIFLEIIYQDIEYSIVLDAKFHEEADIKHLVKELYYDKDYAGRKISFFQEDKDYDAFYEFYFKDMDAKTKNVKDDTDYFNKVFILHPDFNALSREGIVINNQKWGKYSYYGEGVLFSGKNEADDLRINEHDDITSNHRYGAIVINPKNYSYQTMMQRLIGMCLQYYPYVISAEIPSSWLCISCGNVNIETENSRKKIIENNTKRQRQCKYCDNIVVYSWCYTCGTKIIKNGIFWTYHNTNQENIYDIKCPNCFATLDDYKNLDAFYDTEDDTNEWLERMKNLNKDEIEKENSIAISEAKKNITNILMKNNCKTNEVCSTKYFGNVCDNVLNILKTAGVNKDVKDEILQALNIPTSYMKRYYRFISYLNNDKNVSTVSVDIESLKNLIKDTAAKLRIYVSNEDIENLRNKYHINKIKDKTTNESIVSGDEPF